jgi:hypothetical protein
MAHTPRTTVGCLSEGEGRPGELARCLSLSKLRNREVEGDLGGGIAIVILCCYVQVSRGQVIRAS